MEKLKKLFDDILEKDEETQEKIFELIKPLTSDYLTKTSLANVFNFPKNKVEHNLPNSLVSGIKPYHPEFNSKFYVFSYINCSFGRLYSLSDNYIIALNRALVGL